MSKVEEDKRFTACQFDSSEYKEMHKLLYPQVLNSLQLDNLNGKKVIDLACAYGFWGEILEPYGAEILYIDGRREHLKKVLERNPDAQTQWMNLENTIQHIKWKEVDLVLCMGILYHIYNPEFLLNQLSALTNNIIVDSTVADNDTEDFFIWTREPQGQGFGLNGKGCRFSPKYLEKMLREVGFTYIYDIGEANIKATENLSGLLYKWEYQRTCGWRRAEQTLRRMYVACKKFPSNIFKLEGLMKC